MAVDVYQILIQVKNLAQLREFNKLQKQQIPIQRGVAGGIKRTSKATKEAVDTFKAGSGGAEAYLKQHKLMPQTFKGATSAQLALAKATKVTSVTQDRYGKITKANLESQDGLAKATVVTKRRFQDMRQIIGKVAFWAVATTAIYGTQKAMRAAAKMMEEFAVGMARVATVTRGSTEDIGKLSGVVLNYAMGSKAAIGDITTAMYLLGSAGLTVEEQTAGLKHVMDLTVGTFGNIEQVGRLVAGSYNVFGKQMKGMISTSARFKRISDILAFTYSTQQVELAEIAGAFKIVGSASSVLAIDFETLVGTIGALNSGMLKGTRAGTSLMSAFLRVARNSEQLGKAFDIAIDPSRPLNFVDVMNQLNASIGGAVITTDQFKTLMQIFGLRGARSVASIIGRFDEWKKAINVTDATFKDFAENMKNTVEFTLGGAWQKFVNFVKTKVITLFEQDWGAGKLVENVHEVLDALAEEQRAQEAINILAEHQALTGGKITKDLEKQTKFSKLHTELTIKYMKELRKEVRGYETPLEWIRRGRKAAYMAAKEARKALGVPPELTELGTFLLESGIIEYVEKISQRFEDTQQSIDRTLTPAEQFQKIIKTIATTYMHDIPAGIRKHRAELDKLVAEVPGLNKDILDQFNLTLYILEANIELSKETKKRAKEESEIIKKTRKSLKTLAKSAKYVMMQVKGYSEVKILEEKIADAQEKIAERADIIVERLRERIRLGKETEEESRRYQAAMTIILQLRTGILDIRKKENIVAMQALGMSKESIDLHKQELALENLRSKSAQSLAEHYATTTDETRAMMDTLGRLTTQAQNLGRPFPIMGEEMKKFVKETPEAQKFLEQEFETPVNIMISDSSWAALKRFEDRRDELMGKEVVVEPWSRGEVARRTTGREATKIMGMDIAAPLLERPLPPGPLEDLRKRVSAMDIAGPVLPKEITLKPEIKIILPESFLGPEDIEKINEGIRQTVRGVVKDVGGETMEEHEAGTSAPRRIE